MLSRIGFLAVCVACTAGAVGSLSACIFDDGGDYNGGGRRNTGASLDQQDPIIEDASVDDPFADANADGGTGG